MIWKYIIRDLNGAIQYLPYGVMAGAVMGLILNAMNARRERKGKEAFPMAGLMVFSLYLMIILVITFFSREDGSRNRAMEQVLALLRSFGIASVVPERLMDVVVGVSGSSPAYVFMFIEAMADEAVAAGMPRKQAYEFASQSVLGSARMVLETGRHPGELKDMVCSPGGTTIQAVKVLEEKGMRAAVMDAMDACIEKSKSM